MTEDTKVIERKPRWLTRENFRQWLREPRPDEIAGTTNNSGCCPLARFIMAHAGVTDVEIGIPSADFSKIGRAGRHEWHTFDLPKWAADFASDFDVFLVDAEDVFPDREMEVAFGTLRRAIHEKRVRL